MSWGTDIIKWMQLSEPNSNAKTKSFHNCKTISKLSSEVSMAGLSRKNWRVLHKRWPFEVRSARYQMPSDTKLMASKMSRSKLLIRSVKWSKWRSTSASNRIRIPSYWFKTCWRILWMKLHRLKTLKTLLFSSCWKMLRTRLKTQLNVLISYRVTSTKKSLKTLRNQQNKSKTWKCSRPSWLNNSKSIWSTTNQWKKICTNVSKSSSLTCQCTAPN